MRIHYGLVVLLLTSCFGSDNNQIIEDDPFPRDFEFTNTINDSIAIKGAYLNFIKTSGSDLGWQLYYGFQADNETLVSVLFENVPEDKTDWDQGIFHMEEQSQDNGINFVLALGEGSPRIVTQPLKAEDKATIWIDGELRTARIVVSARLEEPIAGYTAIELNYHGRFEVFDGENNDGGG